MEPGHGDGQGLMFSRSESRSKHIFSVSSTLQGFLKKKINETTFRLARHLGKFDHQERRHLKYVDPKILKEEA